MAALWNGRNGVECFSLQLGEVHYPLLSHLKTLLLDWRDQFKVWVILGLCSALLGVVWKESLNNLISSYPQSYPEYSRIQR